MADVVAIIQARMGSTRLPGKVLMPLAGTPVLEHVVRRVQAVPSIDRIVIATSTASSDDEIAAYVTRLGVGLFRGSESDVLDRYYGAATKFRAETVIRITSDCPLLSPTITALTVQAYLDRAGSVDYVSNSLQRTYPRGFDTEVFSMAALERAQREATDASEREHVTLHIYRNPQSFRLYGVEEKAHPDPGLRLTVDTPEDYQMLSAVTDALYPSDPLFDWEMIRSFLATRPEIRAINAEIEQKKV